MYIVKNKKGECSMEIAIPVIGAVIQWILTTMLHIDKAFFIYGQEV